MSAGPATLLRPVHVRPVPLEQASRLINHGPTVLVSTRHQGRLNVMAAAWSMPVEFTPPRIAVVIDKRTFTWEQVMASGCFALSIATRALSDLSFAVGSASGRELDKFARHAIAHRPGPALGLPLIDGAAAWLECRRLAEPHAEAAYDTCFAEVVSAEADERIFSGGHWRPDAGNAPLHTLHHLGRGLFAVAGETLQARTPTG